MGLTDQVIRTEPADGAADFDEIADIVGRARRGEMPKDAALEAIGGIVRRVATVEPAEIYQKPWG